MGGRTGGLGLRVSAKRASVSKRASALLSTTEPDVVKNFVGASAPVNEEPDAEELAATPEIKVQEPVPEEATAVEKAPQFIPRFKGAAEMERRRRLRMAARRGPDAAPPPGPPPTLSFDDSSSDEDNPVRPRLHRRPTMSLVQTTVWTTMTSIRVYMLFFVILC